MRLVQRWVLAKMRNQVFSSLNELNARIRELLDVVNQAPLRGYGVSRRELFERLDGPALKALPATRFVYGEWSACKLRLDYHVEADGHFYSAPHALAGETLHIRISAGTIEIWLRRRRITSHQRSHKKGEYTTNREHMPASHRAHVELTPATLVAGACKTGPQTATKENATLNEETEDKVDEALGHAWGMERPTLDPSVKRPRLRRALRAHRRRGAAQPGQPPTETSPHPSQAQGKPGLPRGRRLRSRSQARQGRRCAIREIDLLTPSTSPALERRKGDAQQQAED